MSLKNNRKSVSLNHNELSKSLKSLYDTNISSADLKNLEGKKASSSHKDEAMFSEFLIQAKLMCMKK